MTKTWYGNVFINPPYGSAVTAWIKAALEYNRQTGKTVVMLIKATTDVSWFHDYLYHKPNIEVRFLKGRLHFVDINGQRLKNTAPFASMIVVMGGGIEGERYRIPQ